MTPLDFSAIGAAALAALAAPIAKVVRFAIVRDRSAPDQGDDRAVVPVVCRILALCALAARDGAGKTAREPTLSTLDMYGAALLARLPDQTLRRWNEQIALDWFAARAEARRRIEDFADGEAAARGGEPQRFPTPWRSA